MSSMTSTKLIRWSGLAAVVGGLLAAILDAVEALAFWDLPTREAMSNPTNVFAISLFMVVLFLGTIVLVGFYTKQVEETGWLGLIGFLVALAGSMMFFGVYWAATFVFPVLARIAPEFLDLLDAGANLPGTLMLAYLTTLPLFWIGWFLFGLASYRAKVLARWGTVLLMVAAIAGMVMDIIFIPFSSLLFDIALIWLGWSVWRGESELLVGKQ